MKVFSTTATSALIGYSASDTKLELVQLVHDHQQQQAALVDHATAFGRLAISDTNIYTVVDKVTASTQQDKIHTAPVELKTEGKATVSVVILSDRDQYEICIVGEEGFNELSKAVVGAEFINWEERIGNGSKE